MGIGKNDLLDLYFTQEETYYQTDLEELVVKGLASQRNSKRSRSSFYASDGGMCYKKNVYLSNRNGEYTFSPASQLYTQIGITFHEEITEALRKQKVLLANDYKLPDIGIGLGSEVDGFIYYKDRVYGLEIKSCGALPSSIKPTHKAQATIYEFITGLPFIVFYISRNIADYKGRVIMKTMFLEVDEAYKKATVENVIIAHLFNQKGKIPNRPIAYERDKMPCKDCEFSYDCYNGKQTATFKEMKEAFESSDDLYNELKSLTQQRTDDILLDIYNKTNEDYVVQILRNMV